MKLQKDRKNEQQGRQPDARRTEEKPAAGMIELDPEQMDKISGGNQVIPPEWVMEDE